MHLIRARACEVSAQYMYISRIYLGAHWRADMFFAAVCSASLPPLLIEYQAANIQNAVRHKSFSTKMEEAAYFRRVFLYIYANQNHGL